MSGAPRVSGRDGRPRRRSARDGRPRGRSAPARALEARLAAAEEVADLLDSLLTRTLERFSEPARKRALAAGRHPAITYPRTDFLFLLRNVRRLLGDAFEPDVWCPECETEEVGCASFLDVGCGVADKLVLARDLGFEAHGIEVDPRVVQRARRTFALRVSAERARAALPPLHAPGGGALTLYPTDALGFDLSGFDVLFFYRPFADEALEKKLERRLWRQARPGAFVIACASVTEPPRSFREVTDLDGPLPPGAKLFRRSPRARRRADRESTFARGASRAPAR